MGTVTTVGLDLAKNVFQVHGVDANGRVLVRRRLGRADMLKFFERLSPCLVGMEACATAHHWARAISALAHTVKMMPPAYVKPYVKRGKTDAADAETICEAVARPTIRFVAIKIVDQQGALMLHKICGMRTSIIVNARPIDHADLYGLIADRKRVLGLSTTGQGKLAGR
jgi:transposase